MEMVFVLIGLAIVVLLLKGVRIVLVEREAEQEREMNRRAEVDRLEWIALTPEERYERVACATWRVAWDTVSAATSDATRAAYDAARVDTSKFR